MSEQLASSKAAATRARSKAERVERWESNGKYESALRYETDYLRARWGIEIETGDRVSRIGWLSDGQHCLVVGEVKVSLNQLEVTYRKGLHPAAKLWFAKAVAHWLRRDFQFGNWQGWTRNRDLFGNETYSMTVGRLLDESDELPLGCDIDAGLATLLRNDEVESLERLWG